MSERKQKKAKPITRKVWAILNQHNRRLQMVAFAAPLPIRLQERCQIAVPAILTIPKGAQR